MKLSNIFRFMQKDGKAQQKAPRRDTDSSGSASSEDDSALRRILCGARVEGSIGTDSVDSHLHPSKKDDKVQQKDPRRDSGPSVSSDDESTLLRILGGAQGEGSTGTASVDSHGNRYTQHDLRKLEVVRKNFKKLNSHDNRGVRKNYADDCMWYYYNQEGQLIHEMRVDDFIAETSSIWASFPDLKFRCHTLSVTSSGQVLVSNNVLMGTHTGKPYSFGPFEEIAPTGKCVVNDPSDMIISFCHGKISRCDVFARGPMTGPMGLYTQIGGFPLL